MGKIFTPLTLSLSLFFTIDRPLVQICFSPQPSAAIKIKDGGHNVRYEISEHSLAKITPAFRAMGTLHIGSEPDMCKTLHTIESGSKAYTVQNYTSIELSNIKNIRLDNGVICDYVCMYVCMYIYIYIYN